MRRPRPPAASSCRRAMTASPATPTRRRCSSPSTTPRSSCRCPASKLHFVGGTVGRRLRRQGRRHRRADRDPRRQADRPAGLLHLQPRRGDAGLLAARGREASYIKDGVMKDGRIVARQVTLLHRCRRLFPPFALRRAERRRRTIPGPYTIPNVWIDCLLRLHQPHAVLAPCAASASRSAISRSRCRWTSWRG